MTVTLRGLCRDHQRCTRPMAAARLAYRTERLGITVAWDALADRHQSPHHPATALATTQVGQ